MATLKKTPSDEAGQGLDNDNIYPGRVILPSFRTISSTADHRDILDGPRTTPQY